MFIITTKELIGKKDYRPTGECVADNQWRSLSVYLATYTNTDTGETGETRLIEFDDGETVETWHEHTLFPAGLDDSRSENILDDFDIEDGLEIREGEYFTLQDWINDGDKIAIDGKKYFEEEEEKEEEK